MSDDSFFDIDVDINEKAIQKKVDNLIDDSVMIEIHSAFARIIDPYVPMYGGNLANNSLEITRDYIRYAAEYAHYMYMGEIYGPNIPKFDEGGNIVGFFSKKGEKKKPTGRPIEYNNEKHINATAEWDKVAMQTQLRFFEEEVKRILLRRAKQLYG